MRETVQPSSYCQRLFCGFRLRYGLDSVSPQSRTQWKEEIEEKTNDVFKVHVHHGKDKLKKLSTMRDKDVSALPINPRVACSHLNRLSLRAMGPFVRNTRSAGKSRKRTRTIG